ncbi:putative polyketide synthase protein [Hypomontagnella submonticulosa]|nr:putative polyketide synthase protein [Hypomontagnella submonticulosa]
MAFIAAPLEVGTKIKISLKGPQETLMGPLIARAIDSRNPESVLNDTLAAEILDKIDYDVEKFNMDENKATLNTLRTLCLDRWTAEFLRNNPDATVVHLACGLDTRWHRLQPDTTKVRWIDVDLPDVVELRTKLIPNPAGDYNLIAADITEDGWLQQIPTDRPTVVVGSGVLMYLEEDHVKSLIKRVVDHFKSGHLIVDCVGTIMLSLQGQVEALTATGSSFKWGIDEPKTLEALHPQLKMLDCLGPSELGGFSKFPLSFRLMVSSYSYLPWYKYLSSYVRFEF